MLPGVYEPRSTVGTVLHDVVRTHLDRFLAATAAATHGAGVPRFIEREFRSFLGCGVLVVEAIEGAVASRHAEEALHRGCGTSGGEGLFQHRSKSGNGLGPIGQNARRRRLVNERSTDDIGTTAKEIQEDLLRQGPTRSYGHTGCTGAGAVETSY